MQWPSIPRRFPAFPYNFYKRTTFLHFFYNSLHTFCPLLAYNGIEHRNRLFAVSVHDLLCRDGGRTDRKYPARTHTLRQMRIGNGKRTRNSSLRFFCPFIRGSGPASVSGQRKRAVKRTGERAFHQQGKRPRRQVFRSGRRRHKICQKRFRVAGQPGRIRRAGQCSGRQFPAVFRLANAVAVNSPPFSGC